ncbi:uncharacterized protein N7496_009323 [Penicillium cataractarum]|uniref:Cytochrome P450 n=1 Tax=Penicillium cataractarum TaxID=2100454 RepID=A0A9W9V219_9EURO|nr:uncharacterized protein N7496_009323 [Penicillium cataractarum]KAJ5363610.1 hypothetical protein N7496_009323 [Penicillium cataractarum]
MAQIYSVRANVRKDDAYSVMSASSHTPSTISCLDNKQHASKRRILAQLFTDSALKGVEDRVLAHINTFCTSLGDAEKGNWGKVKNVAALSDYLTFDIISDLCYGKAFDLLQSEALRYIPRVITHISRRNAICFVQPKVWKYKFDRIFLSTISSQIRTFGTWIKEQTKTRSSVAENAGLQDFFTHLSIARDSKTERSFSQKEIWVELLQLVIAGSDTTAVAISGVFFYLVQNPSALSRATAEILASFDNIDEICSGARLSSCVFLQACINEALRLSPPVTGLAPRKVLPGGIQVDGIDFPEGTIIGSPIYTLHRSKDYFHHPDSYLPERWLMEPDGGSENDCIRSPLYPFSLGPRACVAKKLAMREISLTVARVLWMYEMRTDKALSGVADYQLKGWMTSGRDGPFVQFRRRW